MENVENVTKINTLKRLNIVKYALSVLNLMIVRVQTNKENGELYMKLTADDSKVYWFYPVQNTDDEILYYEIENDDGIVLDKLSIEETHVVDPHIEEYGVSKYLYTLRIIDKYLRKNTVMSNLIKVFIKEANDLLSDESNTLNSFQYKTVNKLLLNFRYSKN